MTLRSFRHGGGFTLIELMVTVVVLAILVAVAVPSFDYFRSSTRVSALANDLVSALNLARSEAITRSEQVTVCPSEDAMACGGAWSNGWIVLVDASGDVLRRYAAPVEGSELVQAPTADAAVTFGPLGEQLSAPTQFLARMTGCRGDRARRLDIAPAGRVSVARVACP